MEKGKITFTEEKFQKIDSVKSVKTGDVVVLQFNILNKEKMRHEHGQISCEAKKLPLKKK